MPPRLRQGGARSPLFCGGGSLSRRTRCVVLGSSRSLRVAEGAFAVARRSRLCCLRRHAGAPSAGSIVSPRSRRRGARPPLLRGGGSLSLRARCVVLGSSRSLRVALGRSPSRGAHGAAACGAALPLRAPAQSCCRTCGGVTLGRRSSVAAIRSLGARGASCSAARTLHVWLWGRPPSRGAHGAAASGAALALLASAQPCRHARGGMTLGRRFSVAAARSLGAPVRRTRQLALSACGSGGGRRRATLTAPLPAAPCWRSWRRLNRVATLAAAWRSAAALPWRRLALTAHVALGGSRSLVWSLARSLPLSFICR